MGKFFTVALLMALSILGGTQMVGGDSAVRTSTACLMAEESTENPDNTLVHLADNYAYVSNIALRHWKSSHVTIAVVGQDGKRSPEETRQTVENAVHLWNQEIKSVVETTVTDQASGDIVIQFVPSQSLPTNTVGRTQVTYGAISGNLNRATIVVQEGLPSQKCLQAVAHEIGHALGIQGHSPNHADLMFDKAHLPAAVTNADANTLRIGYGSGIAPAVATADTTTK